MGMIFIKVIEMSVAATFLMVAVILLRIPLKKAPKWFMGVLWAIVALRLIMPFQIEADFGLLPNIGGMIEEYIYGSGNGSQVTEVVLHDYQPSSSLQSGWMAGIDENGAIIPETADEEIEYLPSEEITTVDTASHDNMTLRKDLFIRLQMIWMFGGLIVLGYALLSYLSIKKKTRVSIRMKGSDNAFVCDEIDTPFILGVFRPVIYLPSGLNDETVRNVLAHEKAHISRCDHVRKQFGFLLLAIHWFNPLVWISYALFCKDIELSCDEKVISHMSLDEKKSYATSLLLCSTHRRFVLAYPLAFGEVGVGTRVKQIFNYKKPTFWLIVMLVLMCAGLSTCFFTSVAEDANDSNVLNIKQTRDGLVRQPWGSDGIYVPVQCDSDESAGWDSDDEEVSYIIENDDRVHSNSNGNVNSTELPNYVKGSGEKFINLPFSDGEDYFENAHEHKSMTDGYSEEADLNGDGKKEKIKVIDLGYQGGDGGYEPHVYGADGKELALPADTRQEPFSLKWTNGNAYVMRDDMVIASLTKDQVHELYLKKGYTEDELEELEVIFNEDEVIVGDDASGFVIGNKDGKSELIVKYLLSGKQGHADTFGYVLLHLTLNGDGTWNETPEYVTDLD